MAPDRQKKPPRPESRYVLSMLSEKESKGIDSPSHIKNCVRSAPASSTVNCAQIFLPYPYWNGPQRCPSHSLFLTFQFFPSHQIEVLICKSYGFRNISLRQISSSLLHLNFRQGKLTLYQNCASRTNYFSFSADDNF